MQEKHLFEYAVIRIVPCVEREEFINAGVIVYCSSLRFLKTRYKVDAARLKIFSDEADLVHLERRLKAFDFICQGVKEGGLIAQLPIASRFRWLTATRSTVVQTSPVHPGMCINAQETLDKLFRQLVG